MVLLIGATGYTGRHILRRLRSAGERVRCLVRRDEAARAVTEAGAEAVIGNLEDASSLPAFESVRAVVNAAHIRYSEAVIAGCEGHGVRRVVALSSTWAFSRFVTPDVEAVRDGERTMASAGLETTLLRPTMIYGPGNDRNISRIRAYISRFGVVPIFGSGDRLVQPVYVNDVAEAVAAVLRRSGTHGREYAVAGPEPMPYGEMIDAIARSVGRSVLKVYVPRAAGIALAYLLERVTARPPITEDQVRRMDEDRAFDIREAADDFGYAPRALEVGLRNALEATFP